MSLCFSWLLLLVVPVHLSIQGLPSTPVRELQGALGGAIDGHEHGEIEKIYSGKSIHKMLKAGLKPLAYRLRTELGGEAWHWNARGTWSDPEHQQGYWTSSTTIKEPIRVSYGYRLPRRGNTFDEANNDGYSRLDDGNPETFWKSNPYLSSFYTGDPESQHPQWILLDFGKKVWINAVRLHWRAPYATKFRVQYANKGMIYFGNHRAWHDFSRGKIDHGDGGAPFIDLGKPQYVQFLRILMLESSGNSEGKKPGVALKEAIDSIHEESRDQTKCRYHGPNSCLRDQIGYAVQEVEAGFFQNGRFQDWVIHRPDQKQTMMTVSSTDPWHRSCDRDDRTEQPGIDLVATSRLGNSLPILWSLPVLYDTPENAAALMVYLKKKGYLFPHQRVELGEEPDGQRIDPKDFGALYAQVAKTICHLFCKDSLFQPLLGGPSFVTIDCQPKDTTYRFDHRLWLKPFLQELKHHHQEKNFQFLTFEWYPFDEFLKTASVLLRKNKGSLQRAMSLLRHGGVPQTMPMVITEYGYSVFSGEPEMKVEAALLNAEIAMEFFAAGGETAYLYGYEPGTLECTMNNSWGNLMMLLERERQIIPLPTFYGAQMLAGLMKKETQIFPIKSSRSDLVVYGFYQPGNSEGALACINENPKHSYELLFKHCSPLEKISYSSKNYQWHVDGPDGYPLKNLPPQSEKLSEGKPVVIEPWSLTILKIKGITPFQHALFN